MVQPAVMGPCSGEQKATLPTIYTLDVLQEIHVERAVPFRMG
jgi:hypothetical protein